MLSAFTIFHAVLSLARIGSGFVVLYGLLEAGQLGGWTKMFLTAALPDRSTRGFGTLRRAGYVLSHRSGQGRFAGFRRRWRIGWLSSSPTEMP